MPPGTLSMMSANACEFYCFSCVTVTYEAMKAAQG